MTPRPRRTGPVSQRIVKNLRAMRRARRISTLALSEMITDAGYPVSGQILRNQELGRVGHVSIDFVLAVCQALDVALIDLTSEFLCQQCHSFPPVGFTCNECGTVGSTS